MIAVAVAGAAGRMGETVCEAVDGAPDMELIARADPRLGVELSDVLDAPPAKRADVVVEFTQPDTALENILACVRAGVHVVAGTTGFDLERLTAELGASELRTPEGRPLANVLVAPNFAIGAVLMMRFAAQAAEHMARAEIVELHHDQKLDAPSGTAKRTAQLMAAAATAARAGGEGDGGGAGAGGGHAGTGGGHAGAGGHGEGGVEPERSEPIPIHSVRLPGLVASQEVILGDVGQTLTIRHDTIGRESFMPGVLLAVRRVGELQESPTIGLERLLF